MIGRKSCKERRLMPRLAAFPKAYMDALCVNGTMTLRQWIEIGADLQLDGLEFYIRFLELQKPGAAGEFRRIAADHGWKSRCSAHRPISRIPTPPFDRSRLTSRKRRSICVPNSAAVLSRSERPAPAGIDSRGRFAFGG